MRIHLIAVGLKPPAWVAEAWREYSRRMPRECTLRLTEIPAGRRSRNASIPSIVAAEGKRMLDALPRGAWVIALDEEGEAWNTRRLASEMQDWMRRGRDVALLVGGPDGLAPACRERAGQAWSLSPLTLPHALVRIVVAEQIYRAWSLNSNHPYHRD